MSFLKIQNLELYIQGNRVLTGVHFEADEIGFLSIIGPNGAGKSVLVKSILGLIKPSQGSVSILGAPAGEHDPKMIGYVPQFKTFDRSFPARAIDLVASGLKYGWPVRLSKEDKELAKKALVRVHAEHLIKRQISQLSGGELQKIYLARALIQPRRLIILDEPSTGIDAFGEADLYKLLEEVREQSKTSILMVTHDLSVAKHHSSQVLLLNHRQIAFGTPSKVLTEENVNRAFGHSEHDHHEGHVHA